MQKDNPPKHLIKSLAYWYVFLVKIINGELVINYHDSNFDVLKEIIDKEGMQGFIQAPVIWGEIPKRYPIFKELLMKNIIELIKEY